MKKLLLFCVVAVALTAAVPEPRKGSNTTSSGCVNRLMNHEGKETGKAALCSVLPHSVARCRTLVGYTLSLPTQFETFLPKPLFTLDSSRRRSVSLSDLSRVLDHSPTGTITAS